MQYNYWYKYNSCYLPTAEVKSQYFIIITKSYDKMYNKYTIATKYSFAHLIFPITYEQGAFQSLRHRFTRCIDKCDKRRVFVFVSLCVMFLYDLLHILPTSVKAICIRISISCRLQVPAIGNIPGKYCLFVCLIDLMGHH